MSFIFLKSLLLGFLITLPLGPIGILCLHKILQRGPWVGFLIGLSQSLVTCSLSIIALFSLHLISTFIIKYQFWLQLLGSLVLIGFGIKIFLSKSAAIHNKRISTKGIMGDFFSIVFLMVTSPPGILGFLAMFTGLGLYGMTALGEQIGVIVAISLGSLFCWALICLCFAKYKKNASEKVMRWINRSVGVFLTGFGIVICLSAFR